MLDDSHRSSRRAKLQPSEDPAGPKLVAFAELLIALDEIRAGSNLSKAELARRVGVKPSVISRLLDGTGRNVQLDTVADVADALDVYIEMRVRPQPKRKGSRHAPIEVLAA